MQRAVLYLRSSKDRHDVSIDVQRRELGELARARGLVVVAEFADVVESGKDEDRPGLQALLKALYARDRNWTVVLALDTSRVARRAAAAYWFEDRECASRGVKVVYKNVPEMEDAERAIFKAMLHGIDEWHSKVSKRKAVAGMKENVRNGHRAGGRAPTGYRLEHVATGAVREGQAVTKSRLVPDPERAPAIAAYLKDRAAGIARHAAARKHRLELANTTLLSIDRNARAYAGHTIWNRHGERGQGAKYRPEAEWEIRRDTHPALITDLEADAILEGLKRHAPARARPRQHDYLLSGLLLTPAGKAWHGERDPYSSFYRAGRARRILARRVETTVVNALTEDLSGGTLAGMLLERMRARLLIKPDAARAAALRRRVDELERKIRRLADLAAGAGNAAAPLLRTMGEVEQERTAAAAELELLEREAQTHRQLSAVTEDQVTDTLRSIAVDVAAARDVPGLRDLLLQLLERVEMDPDRSEEVVLRYRLPAIGGSSPGYGWRPHSDANENPVSWLERRVKLAA